MLDKKIIFPIKSSYQWLSGTNCIFLLILPLLLQISNRGHGSNLKACRFSHISYHISGAALMSRMKIYNK